MARARMRLGRGMPIPWARLMFRVLLGISTLLLRIWAVPLVIRGTSTLLGRMRA